MISIILYIKLYFNPRSARGGATEHRAHLSQAKKGFQSTLRARRSDYLRGKSGRNPSNFNPRSARGGATTPETLHKMAIAFQSTLRARRSDRQSCCKLVLKLYFNPRSARGGATDNGEWVEGYYIISIHAPREAERPQISLKFPEYFRKNP